MIVLVPGLEEIAATCRCYQVDGGALSNGYDAGNDCNGTKRRSIGQAVFPDISSGGGIDCAQSSLATLSLDGGIPTGNIKHVAIPGTGRNGSLSTLRAGATYGYLVLPDRAIADIRAVKGIIYAILVADAHQFMHCAVNGCREKCGGRSEITVAYLLIFWHLPGTYDRQIGSFQFDEGLTIYFGLATHVAVACGEIQRIIAAVNSFTAPYSCPSRQSQKDAMEI